MKIKFRYILAVSIVIISIAATPASIKAAYEFRGYEAIGGEYMIIPIGVIIALFILELAKVWDEFIAFRQRELRRKRLQNNRLSHFYGNAENYDLRSENMTARKCEHKKPRLTPFGKAVTKKLIDRDMRQGDLEQALGMSHRYLTMIIRGEKPGIKYKQAICDYLGLDSSKYTS